MDGNVVAMIVVAAYDIRDDGRRSRVAATLQSWGDRIQKSVFVLDLSGDDLTALRDRLACTIDADTDSLYMFRQCATCWSTVDCVGQAAKPDKVLYWAVL